ncbi:putative heterokaryon incompatibility protein [Podospora fimiseda]|uniref:Heterokaryon incompatibility protein n=1 Tax=Podospora fimiseda TaxID=252190 RepID=A0AAN6YPV9_9PEZI|nr:putative heterokaryon incompatibility protein [Podospora fimiseda]
MMDSSTGETIERLCEFCNGITIETISENGHMHAPTLEVVRKNAAFCRLCKWITNLTWRSRFSNVDSAVEPPTPTREGPEFGNYKLCLVSLGSSQYQNLVRFSDAHGWTFTMSLYFYRLEGAPAPVDSRVPTRKVLTDTSSNHSFETAKAWLQQCDVEHDCRLFSLPALTSSSPLPGRLIDLRDFSPSSPTARLVETINLPAAITSQQGFYTTLSYCWGPTAFYTTTLCSISDLSISIPFDNLPLTFRDALQITTRLGTPFIWIDALCIIQDSLQDWQTESAKMPYIYSQARFTISADSSPDAFGGCFNVPSSAPLQHSLPNNPLVITPKDGSTPLFLYHQPSSLFEVPAPLSIHYSPLSSRGWTFQERILSSRILHYTSEQLFFECRREFQAEDGTHHWPTHTETLPGSVTNIYRGPRSKFNWYMDVVEGYSKRKWTFGRDKLPALSGVARVYAEKFEGFKDGREGYVAGIWTVKPWYKAEVNDGGSWNCGPEVEVGFGLAWRRREDGVSDPDRLDGARQMKEEEWLMGNGNRNGDGNVPKVTNMKRNNTFSWISVDGPIVYQDRYYINGWMVDPPPLEVIGWHVELDNPLDPFGAVGSCSITVKGLLKKGKMVNRKCEQGHSSWVVSVEVSGLGMVDAGRMVPDEDGLVAQGEFEVWCLPILKWNTSDLQVLVLFQDGGDGASTRYRRLGLMTARTEWRIKGKCLPCICSICYPNMYWDALVGEEERSLWVRIDPTEWFKEGELQDIVIF